VIEGFCRGFLFNAPLRYIHIDVHLKHIAPVLKCSNTLSLFIEKVGDHRLLQRFFSL
jgi:hypothetical protein